MPSFKSAAIAASVLSLATAAPLTGRTNTLQGFKVAEIPNPDFTGHSGAAHYAKAAAKYGFNLPIRTSTTSAVSSAGNSTGTTVTANPVGSGNAIEEYLVPVTIGSQQFTLDFDTGSSDLWVGGAGTGASPAFTPSGSAVSGESWQIQYGDGTTASGDVFTESVTVGGVTVTSQAVEVAQTADSSFFQGGGSGLLGLAFDTINTVEPRPVKTWFDNAVAAGLPNVFAADLSSSGPGSYDFGQVDSSAYTGQIAYADVDTSDGLWMFTPDDGEMGIADTGTTLILLSEEGTASFYSGTGATVDSKQGGYTYDCSTTLPDFSITVSGYKATVPGASLNFEEVGGGKCFGGIQSSGGNPFAIYGDVFLKTQYVVFDQRSGSPQLGLAAKAS